MTSLSPRYDLCVLLPLKEAFFTLFSNDEGCIDVRSGECPGGVVRLG